MAVRILTARAHRLFGPVAEELGMRLQNAESSLLLVPEQLTLTAERELMKRLNVEGLFLIDVMSPSRLCEHVLEAAGRDGREPLNDAGRRMAVSQALERLEDKLPYYGSVAQRRGFVEKLSALITDMQRGGLTPEMLADYAAALDMGVTRDKLKDLAQIYAQYRAVLAGRFSDSEDQLAYVAGRLEHSGFLRGKHLYVYGFDTLPEQLMRLLCAAAPLCESLTIGLICDGEAAADGELYTPIRQGVARFGDMLAQAGQTVEICALPPEALAHAPAIAYLDGALFASGAEPFLGKAEGVYLSSGLSPFEEAALMTREVQWLAQNGVELEKIAVLYPEGGGYEFAVTAALEDSGIPFYTDRQMPAVSHGLARFLLSALRAMAGGWRNRDLLGALKSGYAPLTFEECCELENYAVSYGIDRQRWTKPFQKGEAEQLKRCEALRRRLMEPLMRAREALVAARDTQASLTAVFTLLQDVNAYETLKQEEERLLADGFDTRASQNSQIWQATLTLMDQLVRLGGGARIPLKHIATRLECGFAAVTLASLPPAGGMLHAGALGHLLAEEADAVFLLGLNDGVLDRATESLLTQEEREQAQRDTGAYLGLTDVSRVLLARLDLKRAMTLPKRYLFLSCAKTAADGAALRPLSLLGTLQSRLLPGMEHALAPEDELPMSPAQALNGLGLRLRLQADGAGELSMPWQKRMNALLRAPEAAPDAMRLLRALTYDGQSQALTKREASDLFGGETLSVSRLEQFAECPFQHFVTYGLRPQKVREWKVDPIETGTFYHAGLNHFAKLALREPNYPNVSPEAVERMAEQAVEPLLEEVLNGPLGDGERGRARFEQARNAIRRAARVITGQLAAGRFSLYRTEASFGYEGGMPPIVLALGDGREVALRGRIDRIDRYDAPDAVYLRVIDYKSAQQSLEAARTWWGLQLQLLLYLDVCTSAIPGSRPAGAFYFYVADPLVESDTDIASVVESKLREVFQLRGITLSDVEIYTAMDEGEGVLPSIYLKSGELKKTARALDAGQFTALIAHAREVAAGLADRLYGGETAVSPTRDTSRAACDFCEYHAICHFDAASPDAPFRELPQMSMEELRQALSPGQVEEGTHKKQ
ncbi:MAG: PD-(D/E)XK nuclease family protein [Clostridiales bacterium]|nr:PD-(D/E)XK nuclease family protein [Clostridiales bacterium]MDO4350954.1 PD-(D/E)XK nuclease family protein [Eubacteriales bacterium]MDY4007984.1 PD-(D/E)XK nuclease family protein [Candidatus Limiplasma sp.]